MSAQELDFGTEFLTHKTRASGSGFLKNWKEDGHIVVWIHRTAPVISLWSHPWYRFDVEQDDKTNEEYEVIRQMRINCQEKEALLKKRRFRNKDGSREVPPVICPHCLLVEHLNQQILGGSIKLSQPVFEFRTQGPVRPGEEADVVTLYAGGITGWFNRKKLTDLEIAQMRATGIAGNEQFKQALDARHQYVMAVASESDIDAGWMITFESGTLGDKLKKAIGDEIRRCDGDVEAGHPKFNPYPFEWTYDEKKNFDDKFDVVALSRKQPSAKMKELLGSDEHPDFSRIVAPPFYGSLKKSMEDAALIDLPFDQIFERAFETFGEHYEEGDNEEGGEEAPVAAAPEVRGPAKTEPAADDSPLGGDEEQVACDVCESPMAATDLDCAHCGAKYAENAQGEVALVSRPCAHCKHPEVPVATGACPKCKSTHDGGWNATPPAAPPTRATRSRASAASAPTKADGPTKHADAQTSRRSRARAVTSGG